MRPVRNLLLACLCAAAVSVEGAGLTMASGGIKVGMAPSGAYRVEDGDRGWTLKGALPATADGLRSAEGVDALGPYHEISFTTQDPAGPVEGSLRLYGRRSLVLFQQVLKRSAEAAPAPFPDFRGLPAGLHPFSYKSDHFAPPSFALEQGAGPWLLFDGRGRALILSPASNFHSARMWGDGRSRMASGLDPRLSPVPAGFTQRSLLALGKGINATWDAWGLGMTDLQGKHRPANDADLLLNTFGYWTDNTSAYWYHYDPRLGYEGTLEKVASTYKQKGIPLGYMQVDSWWYDKSLYSPSGVLGKPMKPDLPEGEWNRYGGLLDYRADPFVFPRGLKAFSRAIGLPLVNHNRWIDPASPYRKRFRVSGVAAVDPRFWEEIAAYLHDAGSLAYEQDWLNEIYAHSPELASQAALGDTFMDGMAAAFKQRGMSLQYCMALPRQFMQGGRYDNLTTIRVSDDGFNSGNYRDFLYASRLAFSMGIWPWCDVFRSRETGNMILAVLSAGPVGTGDFLGQEDKANILKAARPDGVLVKPDVPLLPTDQAYLAEAEGKDRPLVASTYTDHGGLRTVYGIAVKTSQDQADSLLLAPGELGIRGAAYCYDYFSGAGRLLGPGKPLPVDFHGGKLAFFVAAPLRACGIALLGDTGKFVGMGKKRVASVTREARGLRARILFAAGERRVTLLGYAVSAPKAALESGPPPKVDYDKASGLFTVDVEAAQGADRSASIVLTMD